LGGWVAPFGWRRPSRPLGETLYPSLPSWCCLSKVFCAWENPVLIWPLSSCLVLRRSCADYWIVQLLGNSCADYWIAQLLEVPAASLLLESLVRITSVSSCLRELVRMASVSSCLGLWVSCADTSKPYGVLLGMDFWRLAAPNLSQP